MKSVIGLLLLIGVAAQAAEMGTVVRAVELKQKPFIDAPKVMDLQEKTTVEIVLRQEAWVQVKSKDGKTGWIKMLSLRFGSGRAAAGDQVGGLLGAVSVFNTGSSGNTTTGGVKGLTEEQIRNATTNSKELAKMEANAVSSDDAAKFAKAGKLSPSKVEYLPPKS